MTDKYMAGEEFYEITFEIPKVKGKNNQDIDSIANEIIKQNPEAHNIKVIPCMMYKEPRRLSVSKDDYSYVTWNSKDKSQIIGD